MANYRPINRVLLAGLKAVWQVAIWVWNFIVWFVMGGLDEVSLQAERDKFRGGPNYHASRLGKVHIATWPCLVRHAIVGKLGSHPVLGHLDAEGETITVLMPAPVVYYYGLDDAPGEFAEQIPTLDTWIEGRRMVWFWGVFIPVFGVALAGLFAAVRYIPYFWVVDAVCYWILKAITVLVYALFGLVNWVLSSAWGFASGMFKVLFWITIAVMNSFMGLFGRGPFGRAHWVITDQVTGTTTQGYPRINWVSLRALWSAIWQGRVYAPLSWEDVTESVSAAWGRAIWGGSTRH